MMTLNHHAHDCCVVVKHDHHVHDCCGVNEQHGASCDCCRCSGHQFPTNWNATTLPTCNKCGKPATFISGTVTADGQLVEVR